jgi:transposase
LRNVHCARPEAEYARALEGTWRAEHLFALKQAYELYEFHQMQISACDVQVRKELTRLPDRAAGKAYAPRPRGHGRKSNDVRFEASAPLHRAVGVDLTAIDGIDVNTALVILAELGTDVARFPTEKHFASWLGLCPRREQSNKTEKKRSPRKGKSRVAQALRMAAQAASRTKTALAAFYWRIKARLGGRGAITATAHKLALLVYRALKYGLEYVRQSLEEYAQKVRQQQERGLRRRAALLGYELVPKAPPG